VQWSVAGVGSITSQTNSSATYAAPAMVSAASNATITATSITDATKSGSVQITVNPSPVVITTSVPPATVGAQYSAGISASGGTSPYSWSVKSGSLPSGLSISAGTGITATVTGTPTVWGSNSTTIQVTDAKQISSSQVLSFLVNAPKVMLFTISLLGGVINEPYSQSLQATSGVPPYVWSITSGSLPPGLQLNASSGLISGTPSAIERSSFVAQVTDTNTPTPSSASANLAITINSPLAIATTTLASGSVRSAYAQTISVTGGVPPIFGFSPISGGSLPNGLTLNQNGTVTGTPTVAGTSSFNFEVADSQVPVSNIVTGTLSITITAPSCPNNANLTGNYGFLLNDGGLSRASAVGSFFADGAGNMTSGIADPALVGNASPEAITGSYCIGSNNLGTLTLSYPLANPTNTTLAIAVQADGNARLAVFDGPWVPLKDFSGFALKQDTTAFSLLKITGNYGFGLVGGPMESARSGAVGAFTADGQGNINNGQINYSDGSVRAFTANDFVVSSTGRGTATLVGTIPTKLLVFYIVDASHLLGTIQGETKLDGSVLAGEFVRQAGGPYTAASLSGTSLIEMQATDNSNFTSPTATVGLITFDGVGNFTLNADENNSGAMTTISSAGTYIVSSNGLANLNVTAGPVAGMTLWLVAPNQAFVAGGGAFLGRGYDASFGIIEPQTSGSSFSNASFSGNYYGASSPAEYSASTEVDAVTADGVGNISGATDFINPPGFPAFGTISGTYAVSPNGRGTLTEGGSLSYVFYLASPTKVVLLPTILNPYLVTASH
jgi:hypothetical protein